MRKNLEKIDASKRTKENKKLFNKTEISQTDFSVNAKNILNSVYETLIKKNSMYGGASFDLGNVGTYVHIHDKTTRLRSLIEKQQTGEKVYFESIEDTLKDLIGYATIGLCILEDENNKK